MGTKWGAPGLGTLTGSAERRRPPALPLVAPASKTASNTQETFIPCVPCNVGQKPLDMIKMKSIFIQLVPLKNLGNNSKGNLLLIQSTNLCCLDF